MMNMKECTICKSLGGVKVDAINKIHDSINVCIHVPVVPGFYIVLKCVLTPHSAEQTVHSAREWSVYCVGNLCLNLEGADCSRIAIRTLMSS